MPLTLPPFVQYQNPMFPLRGLWNNAPPEGDKFVSAEIDWLVSPPGNAVQFQLSGNSPVALSQIVAMVVDNSRCGSDVTLVFPDTGFELLVAARTPGGVYPVLTNALMFYAVALNAAVGDVTVLQILNSMPPPVAILPTTAANVSSVGTILVGNGTTTLVAAPANGTLNSLSVIASMTAGTGINYLDLYIEDGYGTTAWQTTMSVPASTSQTFIYNPTGLNRRFHDGLTAVIAGSQGWNTGFSNISINAYYSQP